MHLFSRGQFAVIAVAIAMTPISLQAGETCLPEMDTQVGAFVDGKVPYLDFEIDWSGILHFPGTDGLQHPFSGKGLFREGDRLVLSDSGLSQNLEGNQSLVLLCEWRRTFVGGEVSVRRGAEDVVITIPHRIVARDWDRIGSQLSYDGKVRLARLALAVFDNSPRPFAGLGIMFRDDNPSVSWGQSLDACPGGTPGCIWDVAREVYPSPARDAGIVRGDRIISIDDLKIVGLTEQDATRAIVEYVRKREGPFLLKIEKGVSGEVLELTVPKVPIITEEDASWLFLDLLQEVRDFDLAHNVFSIQFMSVSSLVAECEAGCDEEHIGKMLLALLARYESSSEKINALRLALFTAPSPSKCIFEFTTLGFQNMCRGIRER
jgi:hypothetical protein